MKLEIGISVEKLFFDIACQAESRQHEFVLGALAVGNGISVEALQVQDADEWAVRDDCLIIVGSSFRIQYYVTTIYQDCVGSDRDVELTYPFVNEAEIFFGLGTLALPETDFQATIQLHDVPWPLFTNLLGRVHGPGALDSFFVYSARGLVPESHIYHGQLQDVIFQLAVQPTKSIPLSRHDIWQYIDNFMAWMESNLAPYQQADQINILILQAPDDFATHTNGRAFATGENMLNGIVVYGPQNPDYLRRQFGYEDYAFFLYDGLTHELLHFYTTPVSAGAPKSALFPSEDCPPADVRLLGQFMNLYFHRQYVYQALFGDDERFYVHDMARALNQGRKSGLLDLFILDDYLQGQAESLLARVSALIRERQQTRAPYESATVLLEGVPKEYRELITTPTVPDYVVLIEPALQRRGYTMSVGAAGYEINRRR